MTVIRLLLGNEYDSSLEDLAMKFYVEAETGKELDSTQLEYAVKTLRQSNPDLVKEVSSGTLISVPSVKGLRLGSILSYDINCIKLMR